MKYKKTAETIEHGANTLERDFYVDPVILKKEYDNIFLHSSLILNNSFKFILILLFTFLFTLFTLSLISESFAARA